MAVTASKKTSGRRLFRRSAQVRVIDLADGDVIRLAGRWREVLDVFRHDDTSVEPYMADSAEARLLTDKVFEGYERVGVRYLVDEKSTAGEVEDALVILRAVNLVDIQVVDHSVIPAGGAR